MMKLLVAPLAALMMSAGLVASTGTTAHAEPYAGSVATTTTVTAPGKVKKSKKATLCAKVTVQGGTGTPVGTVTLAVTKDSGGFRQSMSLRYAGGQVCLTTQKLKKTGHYTFRADYASRPGTVFKDSAGVGGFRVVKQRH